MRVFGVFDFLSVSSSGVYDLFLVLRLVVGMCDYRGKLERIR